MWHALNEKRKRQITEGIEPSNQERIGILGEKKNCKYLEILEADMIKQAKMKEKVTKEYLNRTRKLLETKLCSRNLIKRVNTNMYQFKNNCTLYIWQSIALLYMRVCIWLCVQFTFRNVLKLIAFFKKKLPLTWFSWFEICPNPKN